MVPEEGTIVRGQRLHLSITYRGHAIEQDCPFITPAGSLKLASHVKAVLDGQLLMPEQPSKLR
jgi:hypothetical protein